MAGSAFLYPVVSSASCLFRRPFTRCSRGIWRFVGQSVSGTAPISGALPQNARSFGGFIAPALTARVSSSTRDRGRTIIATASSVGNTRPLSLAGREMNFSLSSNHLPKPQAVVAILQWRVVASADRAPHRKHWNTVIPFPPRYGPRWFPDRSAGRPRVREPAGGGHSTGYGASEVAARRWRRWAHSVSVRAPRTNMHGRWC